MRVLVATLLVWVAALGAVWTIVATHLPDAEASSPREIMCLLRDGTYRTVTKAGPPNRAKGLNPKSFAVPG
jgi:hypothetical protein